jgi:hypothetical protein
MKESKIQFLKSMLCVALMCVACTLNAQQNNLKNKNHGKYQSSHQL